MWDSLAFTIYVEFVGIFMILLWGVYLPFRGGQLYNGPFYCMAIGGYVAAYAAKTLGWHPGAAILLAIGIGLIVGFLPAVAFSRTTGIVTATASMALIFIIQAIIHNLDFVGGPNGIWSIPKMEGLLPVICICVFLIGVFVYRIDNSRIGRALEAMRTDPDLAGTLGVNTQWLSAIMMTISSVLGTLAGAFYTFTLRYITAESVGFPMVLSTMTMLFVGGRYTMWGVFISVPIIWGLPQWVPQQLVPYTNIIYGILLVAVLVVRPEGIITRELIQNLKVKSRLYIKSIKQIF